MLRIVSLALVVLGVVAFPASAGAGQDAVREVRAARGEEKPAISNQVGRPAGIATAVDRLVSPLVEKDLVSGSFLIARRGEVLVAKACGLADREHNAPNTVNTAFRIASVSKAMTAVAVLQLAERRRLALDARLELYVPGFGNGAGITIEQLLCHKSGIPSDVYLEGFREKSVQSITLDDAIAWTREKARPRFEPGARFDYSNTGYLLLTSIIEKASGLPYEQYLAKHVFGPAGMTASGLDSASRVLPGRARGYSRDERGDVVNTAYRDPSFGWGDGALYSTVPDLLRLVRGLTGGRLLSEKSRRMLWAAQSETPWGNRYGMGWFIDVLDGNDLVAAAGSTGGFIATLRYFPAADVVVAVLLNQDFMAHEELFDELSRIALGKPWKPILEEAQTSASSRLSTLAGKYVMDDGAIRELRSSGGRLEFGDPGSGTFFPVYALSDNEGYVAEQNARLRFRKAESGEVDLVALYGNLVWRGRRSSEADARR